MKKLLLLAIGLIFSSSSVWACDSCGCEFCEPGSQLFTSVFGSNATPQEAYFFVRLAEQYTDFSTAQQDGSKIANPFNQYEYSSITQVIVGYQFNNDFDVTVSLPYIMRSYQIPDLASVGTVRGHVDGPGDMTVVANYVVMRQEQPEWGYSWRVSAGVKLPTGDDSLLDQEDPAAAPSELNNPASLVGGHDLALGSGSYDGIIGTGLNAHWGRAFITADVDYVIRGTGRDDYRYANEFSYSGGPGYRVIQNTDYSLSLQLLASGEYKRADTVQNTVTDDTGMTSLMLGPKVVLATSKGINANIGVDLPIVQNNTGAQMVPTFRIKAGFTYRF